MTDTTWCLAGELPLADAQKLEQVIDTLADLRGEFPPTLSYFDQPNNQLWRTEVYFSSAPDYGFINTMLAQAELLDWEHEIAPVEEKDWVSESQKLLAPVRAGKFLIHGSHDADKTDPAVINLQIDAGQAFGTGKHETTAACLEALTNYSEAFNPNRILDLGTGSGVLALAAHRLWPAAQVVASDIDPIAVRVSEENLHINPAVLRTIGEQSAGIACIVAEGLDDAAFEKEAPFNLIVANILAGPLVDMAGDITAALAPHGKLVLSGLLVTQEKTVLDAYEAQGLLSEDRIEKGDWLALTLKRP